MADSNVLLIRHAQAEIADSKPPGDWPLTESGSARAEDLGRRLRLHFGSQLTTVVASTECKAIETASHLSDSAPLLDVRLREVSKPWHPDAADHQAAAIQYLRGISIAGWEPQHEARSRFGEAIAALNQQFSVVASHGTVMSLWLAATLVEFDPVSFWVDLQFPDAHLLSLGAQTTISRI